MYYNLYHQEACQFSIFMNNALVPGSTIGSPTGSSQNSCTIIFQITAADVAGSPTEQSPTGFAAKLNVRNHTSFTPIVTLNGLTGSGYVSPQIVATITVFCLRTL
jgi:hypothetical protein